MKLITATTIIAIPTILQSIDTAFFDDFFFKESLIIIGRTNQIVKPIIIEIIKLVIY